MMIAVAVAMSVIIFVWSQGFLSQTSSAAGGQQSQQNIAAQSSMSIEIATFTTGNANTGTQGAGYTCRGTNDGSPKMTIVVRNVGTVAETLGTLVVTGTTSNAGFTGQITIAAITSTANTGGSMAAVSSFSDSGGSAAFSYSTSTATPAKGTAATIVVCNTSPNSFTLTKNSLASGDLLNIKVTSTAGTFATQQFTVP